MSELEIPDEAWSAAYLAVAQFKNETGVLVRGRGAIAPIVRAAAPHIVAAELRRLRQGINVMCDPYGGISGELIDEWLSNRADELDGGAR